jgi:hypothetical protein
MNVGFLDHQARPDLPHQVGLAQPRSGGFDQGDQQIEWCGHPDSRGSPSRSNKRSATRSSKLLKRCMRSMVQAM